MNARPTHGRYSYRTLLFVLLIVSAPPAAYAGRNLLQNGDFAKGSGDQPDHWRTEAWINKPDAFLAHWHPSTAGQPNEVEVVNLQPDDGRWEQALTLAPGGTGSVNVADFLPEPATEALHPEGAATLNSTPDAGASAVLVNVTVVSCDEFGVNV